MLMDPKEDENGTKYDWQSRPSDSLEGMPPKRRRLVVWGLWWFFVLGLLQGAALDALDVPQPWRLLVTVAGLAAVFGPLIRGAVIEARGLRAEGIALPSYPVTPKSLISIAIITSVLWAVFAFLIAEGRPTFPLLPIIGTIWVTYNLLRLRSRQRKGTAREP
ncbi:hypothetical protein AL755_13295 [Arthrobacter sp. ERGS1:01]|nr:hypothetical protein AL755_13295 [Arthrobacter sp. ERGS1:01]